MATGGTNLLNGTKLSAEEFRENSWIRFGIQPHRMIQTCNICQEKMKVDHSL